jgi:cardiolipin synthase (CMP-forming)
MSEIPDAAPRPRSRYWWVPNALTGSRLAAIPILAAIIWTAPGPVIAIGGLLFGAIAITDFIDGKLARALSAESRFGAIADPLADRLLVAVGLIGLLMLGRFHWIGPVAILARDAVSIVAGTVLVRRGIPLGIDTAGKVASAVVMFGVGFGVGLEALWVDILFWSGVVLSVATFINYARSIPQRIAAGHATRPENEG